MKQSLKLRQLVKQKNVELKMLFAVAQTVSSLDLAEVLTHIVKIASKITKADACLVYIFDSKTDELILRASKNPHKDVMGRITMKRGEGLTGWVAQEKKPLAISEKAFTDPRFKFFRSLPEDRFEAFLSVPILNKQGIVGVINVQHQKTHAHTTSEIELLAAIGLLVGGVVENARLIEESLELKDALETRKILEKAKGILMEKLHISEDEAYRKMQKRSMDLRKSLREIAEAILLSESM